MLIALLLISAATNTIIVPSIWLSQMLGVQGGQTVFGAAQTWFISSLLICYLFTPLLSEVYNEIAKSRKAIMSLLILIAFMPLVVVYHFGVIIKESSIVTPLFWYSLAYILGAHYEELSIKKKYVVYVLVLMVASFAIRLLGIILWDNTVVYDKVISSYTHAIGAFCILYVFAALFIQRPGRVIT